MSTIGYNDTVRFSAPSRPVRPVQTARREPIRLNRRGRLFFGSLLVLPIIAVAMPHT